MQRHVVVTEIERAEPEVVDELGRAGAATVHEAMGRRGFVGAGFRARQRGARIAGSAVTVLSHPGDNLMTHAAVEQCREGDVLVVAMTAPSTDGGFGDLLATALQVRGVRGLVTEAGVRDTAELRAMGFPVWSRHVSCQGPVKVHAGSVNVPVVLGGVVVRPGDVVCADDDGVVVVPRPDAPDVLGAARDRLAQEEVTRQRFEAGELGLDVYGLRAELERLGVEYVDRLEPS
ncbi:MAG: 4-carboxy-4-hydroxy-2-oxoadipate aldolase/oxaloacetate decarboxylase [Actinomycetota bacterium]